MNQTKHALDVVTSYIADTKYANKTDLKYIPTSTLANDPIIRGKFNQRQNQYNEDVIKKNREKDKKARKSLAYDDADYDDSMFDEYNGDNQPVWQDEEFDGDMNKFGHGIKKTKKRKSRGKKSRKNRRKHIK